MLLLVNTTAHGQGQDTPLPPVPAPGATATPQDRPAPGELIRDLAHAFSPAESRVLKQQLRDLHDDTGVRVFVLTVNHLPGVNDASNHAPSTPAHPAPLASFTQTIFDRFIDHHPLLKYTDWNRGVIAVLAVGDSRARIAFGPHWNDSVRRHAATLALAYGGNDLRHGRHAAGLRSALNAAGALIRGDTPPPPPRSRGWLALWVTLAASATLAAISVFHRPTGRFTVALLRRALVTPAATFNAVTRSPNTPIIYPAPNQSPRGATSRW
ncbi:MAG: TPM domain-containing protein [Algisphaera sp.]